jgi:hypothetical protein
LHLAFYRGWLQGLDLKTLAEQYLESSVNKLVEPGASVYNVSGSVRNAYLLAFTGGLSRHQTASFSLAGMWL